jgi:hypothetical protein
MESVNPEVFSLKMTRYDHMNCIKPKARTVKVYFVRRNEALPTLPEWKEAGTTG